MDLTINFANYNGGVESGINVYRSAAPIVDGALPAPLTTLASAAIQFVDTDVVRGNKYYYRFGSINGAEETLTPNIVVRAVPDTDTGPGPQKLVMGDWDLGYFGLCRSADLITYATLASNLGITQGTANPDYDWLKVAYKGKVLFVARGAARYSLSFNNIYDRGAVYGTDDNGPVVPTGGVAANQFKPITIASTYTLLPRIMKTLADGAAPPAQQAAASATILPSNEWDDIMGSFFLGAKYTGDVSQTLFGMLDECAWPITSATNFYSDYTQQTSGFTDPSIVTTRGARVGAVKLTVPAVIARGVAATPSPANALMGGGNIYGSWRPVLELVL